MPIHGLTSQDVEGIISGTRFYCTIVTKRCDTALRQAVQKVIRKSVPKIRESAPKMRESTSKIRESALKMRESALKIRESTPNSQD